MIEALGAVSKAVYLNQGTTSCNHQVPLTEDVKLWSEHAPHLCSLYVSLYEDLNSPEPLDRKELSRSACGEITADGQPVPAQWSAHLFSWDIGMLHLSAHRIIHPPMWIPGSGSSNAARSLDSTTFDSIRGAHREAAFVAADELGFYYQVECASWANGGASVGNGKPLDQWLYDEADRILTGIWQSPVVRTVRVRQ